MNLTKSDFFKLCELSGHAILIEDVLGDFIFDYINKIIVERTEFETNGYPMVCNLTGDISRIGFHEFDFLYEYLGDVALIDIDNDNFTRITRLDILDNNYEEQFYEIDYTPNVRNCLLKLVFTN